VYKLDTEIHDSIVFSVLQSFIRRSELGISKYGTTLDRDDLSVLEWIQHAQEEHMDAILYLEKLKSKVVKEKEE
jgi:hypothetical protein